MNVVYLIFIFFFVSALLDYIELLYFWQLKEYRLDRFRDFLGTVLGKQFILSYKIIFRPVVFLLFLLSFQTISILALIFALDIFKSLLNLSRHRFNRPKFTTKAIAIIFIAIFIESIIFALAVPFIWTLAASRFLIISLAVFAIYLPTIFLKKYYYKKAAQKLSRYKNLKIIGVTGSYGKTTVKNFLEQLLNAKFKVIKTPKNINTELGIARFILQTDFSQIDIFIVEMAAYKIGEIKTICEIVKPQIGILTAINEQHLPLFGNIKNTQKAKYELLYSLPQDGLAIINSDNQYAREFIHDLKCQVKTFGTLAEFKPDLLISSLATNSDKLDFRANNYQIKTNIIGEYNAMNIAPIILVAENSGFSKSEIEEQAKNFRLPDATMQIINYGTSTIIDDSYNSNPEAFAAALKFLANYKTAGLPAGKAGKKIVISRGMVELGEASQEAHKRIGKLTAETADEFIITSPDSVAELKTGINNKIKLQTIFEPIKLLEFIKSQKNQNNIILLEGRMPEIIKKEINALTS